MQTKVPSPSHKLDSRSMDESLFQHRISHFFLSCFESPIYPVLSSQLQYQANGEQRKVPGKEFVEFLKEDPHPVNGNILLAKLRPGQEIIAELHAVKGIGRVHAKWSPVSTASYRILPEIFINSNNPRLPKIEKKEEMEKFRKCFPEGVIGIRKVREGNGMQIDGEDQDEEELFVHENGGRLDTVSREVLRYKEFEGKVQLGRRRDHFLCEFFCLVPSFSDIFSYSLRS